MWGNGVKHIHATRIHTGHSTHIMLHTYFAWLLGFVILMGLAARAAIAVVLHHVCVSVYLSVEMNVFFSIGEFYNFCVSPSSASFLHSILHSVVHSPHLGPVLANFFSQMCIIYTTLRINVWTFPFQWWQFGQNSTRCRIRKKESEQPKRAHTHSLIQKNAD